MVLLLRSQEISVGLPVRLVTKYIVPPRECCIVFRAMRSVCGQNASVGACAVLVQRCRCPEYVLQMAFLCCFKLVHSVPWRIIEKAK
jgi:hypothetical protein